MKKVSVIVPVYNTEKYLEKCLDSIINQTYKNLEIILVDDGSPDNSGSICDEYAIKDSRIKVIHKENGGLSSARNAGLDIATGDYIAFIDSDDYVKVTLFEEVVAKLEETKADVCMFSHITVTEKGEIEHKLPLDKDVYDKDEIKNNILPLFIGQKNPEEQPLLGFVCRQIFKNEAINSLRFRSEREYYAEDIVFDLEFYVNAKKMCVLDKPFYYYRYVSSSLSNKYRKNLFEKLIKLINFKKEVIENYKIQNCNERIYRSVFRAVIGGIINIKKAPELSKKQKREKIKETIENEIVKKSIKKVKTNGLKEEVLIILIKLKLSGLILTLI